MFNNEKKLIKCSNELKSTKGIYYELSLQNKRMKRIK